jgi:GMP synthase (glutamine-hydrolysing)
MGKQGGRLTLRRRPARKSAAPKRGAAQKLSVLAIRHLAFEDLGSFETVLRARGFRIGYREAGLDDLGAIDPLAPDLLVVLGGPVGAYEEKIYPFIRDELRILERRLGAKRATLGICLGAQLMARALGVKVYPGPGKEIGWAPIALTAEGLRSPLKHLAPDKCSVLHWHGDTFDLPSGAVRLAATEIFTNQAFALGKHALALQFHAEVTAPNIERWFIGHCHEIAGSPNVTVEDLRAQTARHGPALQVQGPKCLAAWLDAAGLRSHIAAKTKK